MMTYSKFKIQSIKFNAGFSAVELLIVLVIIIIIALISIPIFKNFYFGMQLNGVIKDLSGGLRYAQQLAVTEQVYCGVRFIALQNKYEVVKYSATPEVIESKTLPEEVNFYHISFSNSEVKFNPYGAALEQGEIVLINAVNATSTIEIRPSGFVKIIK